MIDSTDLVHETSHEELRARQQRRHHAETHAGANTQPNTTTTTALMHVINEELHVHYAIELAVEG